MNALDKWAELAKEMGVVFITPDQTPQELIDEYHDQVTNPKYGLYVAGIDPYHTEENTGLGAFEVIKRNK